jgi:hypothetical protein
MARRSQPAAQAHAHIEKLGLDYLAPSCQRRQQRFDVALAAYKERNPEKATRKGVEHESGITNLSRYLKNPEPNKGDDPINLAAELRVDPSWLDQGSVGDVDHLACPDVVRPILARYAEALRCLAGVEIWIAFTSEHAQQTIWEAGPPKQMGVARTFTTTLDLAHPAEDWLTQAVLATFIPEPASEALDQTYGAFRDCGRTLDDLYREHFPDVMRAWGWAQAWVGQSPWPGARGMAIGVPHPGDLFRRRFRAEVVPAKDR